MVLRLSRIFRPTVVDTWQSILVALSPFLDHPDLYGDDIKHFGQICRSLMCKGTIAHGSYDELHRAVGNVDAQAAKIVEETSIQIKALQPEGPSEPKRPRTGEGAKTRGVLCEHVLMFICVDNIDNTVKHVSTNTLIVILWVLRTGADSQALLPLTSR
ncbi:uncharacterized protein LOC110448797 [Mizuhopecten yessoensis]|uniref:uncharacterized protein LOC110448797 n=1 Tax=Mizuhopecten yessoensis TaxID=6573 RepID=UPI000B458932|nr:uncharacterized protein LOC110448797 [Mizuhopecten yessoensis]